ncbi:MAG: ABC transporter permease [Oscillospiraceae bacterium]|nr:ABC transporter permease [Oscillospiraceae bacterium]
MNVIISFINSLPGAFGQGLAWGIMAIGVYITYRILDIADLTVDGSLATGGAVAAICISLGMNPWLAVLLAVLAGMLAGLATGIFHTMCGIPAILSGILTQLALYSLNLRIMAIGSDANTKATVALSVDNQDLLLSSRFVRSLELSWKLEENNPIFLLLIVVLALIAGLYWFFGTELGCSLRATGANQNMARAQGINTDSGKVLALVVSNGLVALSGALLAQYQGSATVDMGRGAIVIGLAAVIIGEVVFKRFANFAAKMVSVCLGAIIYYVVITLVLRLGLESTDLKLLTALVVAAFLTVPYLTGKRHAKLKKGGTRHA